MNRFVLSVFVCMALGACQEASDFTSTTVSGRDAYDQVCASCHDYGVDGAPRTDHPAEWEGRSMLWQAVLFEHAKAGYLEMPAKGGDESLGDEMVSAAAEYMIERTRSDLPPD